jgi:hypothetical protein
MPRDGAMTFGDLLGRLDWLDIVCAKCDKAGDGWPGVPADKMHERHASR